MTFFSVYVSDNDKTKGVCASPLPVIGEDSSISEQVWAPPSWWRVGVGVGTASLAAKVIFYRYGPLAGVAELDALYKRALWGCFCHLSVPGIIAVISLRVSELTFILHSFISLFSLETLGIRFCLASMD